MPYRTYVTDDGSCRRRSSRGCNRWCGEGASCWCSLLFPSAGSHKNAGRQKQGQECWHQLPPQGLVSTHCLSLTQSACSPVLLSPNPLAIIVCCRAVFSYTATLAAPPAAILRWPRRLRGRPKTSGVYRGSVVRTFNWPPRDLCGWPAAP